MIEESYVSFETAKLLKEKGFDERLGSYWSHYPSGKPCLCVYSEFKFRNTDDYAKNGDYVSAPTQQMAMRWLREVHKLNVEVCLNAQGYEGIITILFNGDIKIVTVLPVSKHDTWEEAAEVAIRYCLEKLI